MSLLSDRGLFAEITAGGLALDPFEPELIQPSSVDVRLDNRFRVFNTHLYTHIDPSVQQDDLTSEVVVPEGQPFVLHPGEFVLGSTLEVVSLSDRLAGRLEGKSSLGRLGLMTHSTAGWIDPGFSAHVTLELSNVANLPIVLWPGMKIGQLCVFRLSSPAAYPYGSAVYGSRYQGLLIESPATPPPAGWTPQTVIAADETYSATGVFALTPGPDGALLPGVGPPHARHRQPASRAVTGSG